MAKFWKNFSWNHIILGLFSAFALITVSLWVYAEVVNWRIATFSSSLDFVIKNIREIIVIGCGGTSAIAILVYLWDERRTHIFLWNAFGQHWKIPRKCVKLVARQTDVAGQKLKELSKQKTKRAANMQEVDDGDELGEQSTDIMAAKRRMISNYAVINDNERAEFIKFRQTGRLSVSPDVYEYFYDLTQLKHSTLATFRGMTFNEDSEADAKKETVQQLIVFHGLVERGSLENICLDPEYHLTEIFKSAFMQNILTGLEYLHRSKIGYHGFLQASNCLVGIDWVVKLSLFGISNFISPLLDSGVIEEEEVNPQIPIMYFARFPPEHIKEYCPDESVKEIIPRMIRGSQKGDIYCAGMIFFMIIQRKDPFGLDRLQEKFRKDIISEIIRDVNPTVPLVAEEVWDDDTPISICLKCWKRDPKERPSVGEVLELVQEVYPDTKRTLTDMMIRKHSEKAAELEEIVQDRTQELERQRVQTDRLLHAMLPPSVAKSLRNGEQVQPKFFQSVTVMFIYILGFQEIVRKISCDEFIQFLNDVFDEMDKIVDKHDAYKVETIGESYMVASGVPVENEDHVHQVAMMSLKIREMSGQFRFSNFPDYRLSLRIGFHSGPIAAGVIGFKAPRYCLFGDTVNFASRMQSNCPPDKIMTSAKTAEKIIHDSDFDLLKHGIVHVKGKGDVTCYLLNRKVWQEDTEDSFGN